MTAIVGVLCEDGVVVGSDSSVTFMHGRFGTIEQPADKIKIINNSIIVAGTGSVGLGQRFLEIVKKKWSDKKFDGSAVNIGKHLSRKAIEDFNFTGIGFGNNQSIDYGALIAFPSNKKFYLCELDPQKFQPEMKDETMWYCSMGSAQIITDPFLGFIRSIFWRDKKPNLSEGVLAVKWTLLQAIELNTGGVNGPIHIAVLHRDGSALIARQLSEEELDNYRQSIQELRQHIESFKEKFNPAKGKDLPEAPRS